ATLSPPCGERAGRGAPIWFMVPVHAKNEWGLSMNRPLSRPSATLSPPCGERAGRGVPIWFMVPMHAQKRKEAFHEPASPPVQSFVAYATKVRRDRFMAFSTVQRLRRGWERNFSGRTENPVMIFFADGSRINNFACNTRVL